MRKVDPADLWFGAVFGLVAAGVFALAAIVVWDSATNVTSRSNMWSFVWLWIAMVVVRGPIGRLRRGPRLLAWFAFGTVSFVVFMLIRGEPINPGVVAGMSAGLALLDLVMELYRARREANNG